MGELHRPGATATHHRPPGTRLPVSGASRTSPPLDGLGQSQRLTRDRPRENSHDIVACGVPRPGGNSLATSAQDDGHERSDGDQRRPARRHPAFQRSHPLRIARIPRVCIRGRGSVRPWKRPTRCGRLAGRWAKHGAARRSTHEAWTPISTLTRWTIRPAGSDEEDADGDVLACGCQADVGVEDLVIAEHGRAGVGRAVVIGDGAGRVEQRADNKQ